MNVYRLCRVAFKALDGEGACLYGGRWNSPGRSVVYTSSTLALAAIEYLVHLDPAYLPTDLVAVTIRVADDLPRLTLHAAALPKGWHTVTGSPECRDAGDAWLAGGKAAALRVPAAPIPEEFNVLLDPSHPSASKWSVIAERPFTCDPRLLG